MVLVKKLQNRSVLNAGALDPVTQITSIDIPMNAWRTHFEINVYSLVTALIVAPPSLSESANGGKATFVSSCRRWHRRVGSLQREQSHHKPEFFVVLHLVRSGKL